MADGLQLRLLGPVQILHSGQPARGFESRKALALLCYVAARQQAVTRDHLADLFWPAKSPEHGHGNLSRVLHNLGRVVPGALDADRHTITFNSSPANWLDLAAYESLARQGSVVAIEAATELYRGEFIADLFLDDCPDFELWLVSERERWRGRTAELLHHLVNLHSRQKTYAEGLLAVRRLLALEPWHEEGHRQAMFLLAKSGQPGAALDQYAACCRAIERELATKPSRATEVLFEQIRAGDVSEEAAVPSPASPTNIEGQLTVFVGRERELANVAWHLADPACRLITLVGPGGMGKTRLALEAALQSRSEFRDGVWLVRLAGISSPDELVPAVADAVAIPLSGASDTQAQLFGALGSKQLLLVLDNFEHVLEAADVLVAMIRNTPLVKILTTSRVPLDLQAEWLVPVDGLAFPERSGAEGVDALRAYSAIQLFTERAKHVQPAFDLTGSVLPDVARICQLVEGMPLAIELAAAWARDLSCAEIGDAIERGLDILATTHRDVPGRQRSLRAVLEPSWAALAPDNQRALARLSVFRGGFQAEAAAEVAQATSATLAELTASYVVARRTDGRYELHELMRQYAAEKLAGEGGAAETAAVARQHAVCYLALAEAAEPELKGVDQGKWLARLELEHDNLRAALSWSIAVSDAEIALPLAGSLARFWELKGYFKEGRDWLRQALGLAGQAEPPAARAKALTGAGSLAEEQGDFISAQALHRESLTIRRELGDQIGIAESLNNLGNVADLQGDYDAATGYFTESLALRRALGDRWGVAVTQNNLGNVANFQGLYDAARDHYSDALCIFRELGDQWAIAVSLNNLGLAASELGEFNAARLLLQESLAIARQLDDRQGVAYALQNLGDVACREADYEVAGAMHHESLAMRLELGDHQGIAWSLESLATLFRARGGAHRAAQLLGAADALRQAIHAPRSANEQPELDAELAALRIELGERDYQVAWEAGRLAGGIKAAADILGEGERAVVVPDQLAELDVDPTEGFAKTDHR